MVYRFRRSLQMMLRCLAPLQMTLHEIHHQRPRQLSGMGVIADSARIDVTVPAERKEVPLQGLAVIFEGLPHFFLDR